MHDCPFCGDPIDAVLARFGGTCPRCFGEVPGEDAATDPGITPDPLDAGSDRPRLSLAFAIGGGAIVGVSLAILAVLSVRGGRPAPRHVLDFDHWPMPEIVSVAEALVPEPEAEPGPTSPRRRPEAFVPSSAAGVPSTDLTASLRTAAPPTSGSLATTRKAGPRGPARARAVPTSRAGTSALSSAGTGIVDVSLGGGRVERDDGVVLDDPAAIRMMIGQRLRRGIAELRGCYDRRLKQRPDLSGRWRLTFTVSEEGRATGAKLAGLDTGDEALERCLRHHVSERWAFARVAEATEVSRTITFHVGR